MPTPFKQNKHFRFELDAVAVQVAALHQPLAVGRRDGGAGVQQPLVVEHDEVSGPELQRDLLSAAGA